MFQSCQDCLLGLNKVRTHHSDFAGGEMRTSISSIPSLMLYQLKHCALLFASFKPPFLEEETAFLHISPLVQVIIA